MLFAIVPSSPIVSAFVWSMHNKGQSCPNGYNCLGAHLSFRTATFVPDIPFIDLTEHSGAATLDDAVSKMSG